MTTQLNMTKKERILQWALVSSDQEYEKYFRFKIFQLKFQKALPKSAKQAGYDLLMEWHEAGLNGKDVALSIVEALENVKNPLDYEIRQALEFAIKAITDGNTSMLSEAEIEEAHKVAASLYKEALEDSLLEEENI